MSILEQIRAALQKSELPNVEIAKRIDVNPVNLSHFKAGRIGMSVEKLETLAAVLGLQITTKRTPKK